MRLIPDDFDWRAYDELPERSKVIPASSLADAVVDEFYGSEEAKGAFLPWDKARDKFRLRANEVTLWAGVNGHGKSLVTSQVALGLMRQGDPVLIASFEMPTRKTMRRLSSQAAVSGEPSIPYIRAFHAWTDGRLWLYDHLGTCRPEQAVAVAHYAARELGVKHVVIDSLMKCVRGTDDYSGQKEFVGDLCSLALATGAHVHLVAHMRKGERETDAVDKFDVRGAGEIADQVDNVVLVQRNKRKERAIERGEPDDGAPDLFLGVVKQRHGAYEGTLGLWFDAPSLTYSGAPGKRAAFIPIELDPEAAAERAAIMGESA